jgi:hypothetical protein
MFVLFCVLVAAYDWLTPGSRSPADCVYDQETEKAAKFQQRAVETMIDR